MRSKVAKTLGLVAALVATVGMTVFAAPSPSAAKVTATDESGKAVVVTETQASQELKTETVKEVMGSEYTDTMEVAYLKDLSAVFTGTLTVNFPVAGVTASTKAQVLHFDGAKWEKVPTSVSTGVVTGKFKSLSPVAVVVDKATLASDASKSDKTSASATAAVAVLGLAAVAGLCGTKKNFAK